MRSIFSIRFLAALLAVVGLLVGLALVFDVPIPTNRFRPDVLASGENDQPKAVASGPTVVHGDEIQARRIDFVERVFGTEQKNFAVVDHLAASDAELLIDGVRSVMIKAGTPGEDYCGVVQEIGSQCAIVADLLGEGVVWFALVPISLDEDGQVTVRFPAIDELVDGRARLVNGWEIPYDPVLTRLCVDDGDPDTQDDFESYRQFREVLGADFTSIFSIRKSGDPSRLSAVECRTTVPYARESIRDAHYRVEYSST